MKVTYCWFAALALFACSEEPPVVQPEPPIETAGETETLSGTRPFAGDKLIFRMAAVPADCAGITFTWEVPGTEEGAEFSYAYLLPDGTKYRTPFMDARKDAGQRASLYFDLGGTGRPVEDFHGKTLFLHIRVSKGRLILPRTGPFEFGFHPGGDDGVSWFRDFSTCPAELVKGEVRDRHEAFGHDVHAAGDVNADGVGDVLVSSFLSDSKGPLTGAMTVFSGSDGTRLHRFEGDRAYARFGRALAEVGDLDGDFHAEIAVGAPGGGGGVQPVPGAVHVYSGRTGAKLYRIEGLNRDANGDPWPDGFGAAVSGLDDVNGDGTPDLLVGAPGWTRWSFWEIEGNDSWARGAGYAAVFSGRTGKPLYQVKSAKHASSFGRSTASLGDLNQDGVPDFIVSAWGLAEVFSGTDGSPLFTLVELPREKIAGKNTGADGANFGWAVSGAGDVNADGTDDILVSGYLCYVNLYSGRDGSLLRTIFEQHQLTIPGFADTVAPLGDLDRDGHDDVFVGRAESFEDQDSYDAVVYSGKDGQPIRHFGSNEFTKVGALGDLDRDGYPDLLLGLPKSDRVLVLSGAPPYVALPVKDSTGSLYVGTRGNRVLLYLAPWTE